MEAETLRRDRRARHVARLSVLRCTPVCSVTTLHTPSSSHSTHHAHTTLTLNSPCSHSTHTMHHAYTHSPCSPCSPRSYSRLSPLHAVLRPESTHAGHVPKLYISPLRYLLWRQLRGLRGATVASSTLACTVGAFSVCRRGEAFLKASMHCRRDRVTPG